MIHQGEKLIVWDSSIQDMYAAIAEEDAAVEQERNLLVRICGVIAYPMQRTITYANMPNEQAPLPEGTICRLRLICKGWLCFDLAYEPSLAAARALLEESVLERMQRNGNRLDSVTATAARAEYEILLRHKRGIYKPRLVMGRDIPLTVHRKPAAARVTRKAMPEKR